MYEILDEIKELLDEDICRKLVVELSKEIKSMNEQNEEVDINDNETNQQSNSANANKSIPDKLTRALSSSRDKESKVKSTRLLRQAINSSNTTNNNKRVVNDSTSSKGRVVITNSVDGYTTKRPRLDQSFPQSFLDNSMNPNDNLYFKMQEFARTSGFNNAEEMMAVYQQNIMSPMLNMMMSLGMQQQGMIPPNNLPYSSNTPFQNFRGGPGGFRGRGRNFRAPANYPNQRLVNPSTTQKSDIDQTKSSTVITSTKSDDVSHSSTTNIDKSNADDKPLNATATEFHPKSQEIVNANPAGRGYSGRGFASRGRGFPSRGFSGRFAGRGRGIVAGRSANKTWVRENTSEQI
eukprot:CAMPEP_0196765516 /NCGR_PEP_ID=MMETSP1095-20130614/9491_1 /TAXON_ID=96789 ORGANISM="Chromulina nebulosa, Strain UTEXLB2642" /NCGR_SAMPLE_ID=MMETSP1095 /ASSEMBLY_ACC=CAM_ASM_000446 /LENGTH=348 /DNA_ID=CAMNT_0042123711 /DNA_START=188 /DNA_END=1231 /DNA_ORIENTATION=+